MGEDPGHVHVVGAPALDGLPLSAINESAASPRAIVESTSHGFALNRGRGEAMSVTAIA